VELRMDSHRVSHVTLLALHEQSESLLQSVREARPLQATLQIAVSGSVTQSGRVEQSATKLH
jgi:hypothetical protein